jgi:hypothetical protein
VLGLGEAAPSLAPLARAVPGKPATMPIVREPPASMLSTAARRCARRMKKTALSSLLIEVMCALRMIRRRLGDGWV